MTPVEANKILEMFLHKQCDLKRTEFAYDQSEVWLAVKTAKDALEKQTPKKVVSIQRTAHDFEDGVCKHSHYPCEHLKPFDHEYKYTDYKCPVCGKLTKDSMPDFCWNCGQALDWSDEK